MKQQAIITSCTDLSTAITATPAVYGLSPLQASGFAGALTDANTKILDCDAAKTAYKAALQARNASLGVLESSYQKFSKIIYAVPAMTPELLAAAGLPVHQKPSTRLPKQPLSLVVTPILSGGVQLSWKRNGNPYGISFLIEQKIGNGDWTVVTSSLAAKTTLTGYPAGNSVWFRIVALNRGIRSLPSQEIPIYGSSAAVELKIAA